MPQLCSTLHEKMKNMEATTTKSEEKTAVRGLVHGALPAFLMAVSVGQIYAFSNYYQDLGACMGLDAQGSSKLQLAFSLGIFFLGMGAAFFGPLVERAVKKSALVGLGLFIYGLCASAFCALVKSPVGFIVSYGVFLGLGTGVIYITPVKTMMMWFEKHKAVAASIPIVSFGLGSTLSVSVYNFLKAHSLTSPMCLFALAGLYTILMAVGTFLLRKPKTLASGYELSQSSKFSYTSLFKMPYFIGCWLFMLLNISAGLCLIPLSKQLMTEAAYSGTLVVGVLALAGLFNGGGRLVFAAAADKLKTRHTIMLTISSASLVCALILLGFHPSVGIVILFVNMLYGAGFSVIPAILSDKFGMDNISKIHGAVLSAWGIAGLVGNQAALRVCSVSSDHLTSVGILVAMIHALAVVNFFAFINKAQKTV